MSRLHTFGSLPFGAGTFFGGTAVLPAGLFYRVSKDRDFLRGLTSTAMVEVDVNSNGTGLDGHLGQKPNWQPVAGLASLSCCLVWQKSVSIEGDSRPGMMRTGVVLFGRSVAADRRHRLVIQDADYGELHAYLTGAVRDAHQNQGHHWECQIQDRPL